MEKFENSIFNEQWDKALEFISKDENLIFELNPYDISWKIFYYSLVENGKEKHIPPFGKKTDLNKLVEICKVNGITGKNLPQATAFKDKNQINFLLENGHKINEEDFGERTALMVASALNDKELVSFLIKKNANVSHFDQDNLEAIDFTTSNEIIEILKANGGKTEQERDKEYDDYCNARESLNESREINLSFMKSAENGNFEKLEKAFNQSKIKTLTLNFAYPINGWTALHYAVKNNDKKSVKFLIENGIDIEKRNLDNLTAKELAEQLERTNLFTE